MTLHLPEQLALDLSTPLVNDGRCFRRDAAASVGLSRSALRAALHDGTLRRVLRGVFVDARRPDDTATRLAALELVTPPDAVVARSTAAWARGVDVTGIGPRGDPPVVECIVPSGRASPRRAGVRGLRLPLVDDDVEQLGGVRCTTPLRTAVDVLFQLRRHLALAAVDSMACAGRFTPDQLIAEVGRWPDRRGYARARRLASYCEPGAQSFGESWLRLRILDAGFPRPAAQVPLWSRGCVEYRLDLGYPWRRLGFEYDGLEFHSSAADLRRDERRRTRIREAYGWTVLVAGRGDILGRSLRFERAVGELLGRQPRTRRRTW
jgi:hypothetical protein